ncbi:hypothetical protein V7122_21735, partial [Bacillus sp. JJ1532]
ERIFYCQPVDDIQIIHNGAKHGFIRLTMRCNSPYTYSPYYEYIVDLSKNSADGTEIKISNKGEETFPELWIITREVGNISIVNKTDGGRTFSLTNLQKDESLYIDNENED